MTIPAGKHSHFRLPSLIWSMHVMRYDVLFTDSCMYTIDKQDQGDINKLFGIGYWPHHHQNSVRFGWNYLKADDINIYAYWYRDCLRYSKLIGTVKIGMRHTFVIMPSEKWHNLQVQGRGIACTVPVPGSRYGYHLGPYFGGNQVAPHDITIMMDKL